MTQDRTVLMLSLQPMWCRIRIWTCGTVDADGFNNATPQSSQVETFPELRRLPGDCQREQTENMLMHSVPNLHWHQQFFALAQWQAQACAQSEPDLIRIAPNSCTHVQLGRGYNKIMQINNGTPTQPKYLHAITCSSKA